MKENKFYSPFTHKMEHEVRIERDDIEQAISWFHRMPITATTAHDEKVYEDLMKVVAHLRSLDIK